MKSFLVNLFSITFLFVAVKSSNETTPPNVSAKLREFLFRNRPKEFAPVVVDKYQNNIQNKPMSNNLVISLSKSKMANSLTTPIRTSTTSKTTLSTYRTTETTLPIPEYNMHFLSSHKTSASSATTTSSPVLTPKLKHLFYLNELRGPTRNFLIESKLDYMKTTTPYYFHKKFHFTDYMGDMRGDDEDDWSDKYERKTFKNDFDDSYENY